MRKLFLFPVIISVFLFWGLSTYANSWDMNSPASESEDHARSIEKVQQILKPEIRSGSVILGENQATIHVPEWYEYVSASGANFVLEDMWGNNHDDSVLWLIVPQGFPEDDKEWGVVISYRDSGHISDSDANELLDSAKLLKSLQESQTKNNVTMEEQGLVPFDIVGWMANPAFDSVNKKLSWGLRMRSREDSTSESLNYQIRILGREGYMNLEGLGWVSELPKIRAESEKIMQSIEFNAGKKYADYNPSTDKLAEYGLLGLLGGGVIAKKVGIFAILLKFWKIILIGIVAFFVKMKSKIIALFRRLTGKKPEEAEESETKEEKQDIPTVE